MSVMDSRADRPFPLIHTPDFSKDPSTRDEFSLAASWMTLLHNGLIRGLNTIYMQAPHIGSYDLVDFIDYSLAWIRVVESHHDGEEECLFPDIVRAVGDCWQEAMEENLKQHETFHNGLMELTVYLNTSRDDLSNFSSTKLLEIIDGFAPALCNHLSDEIPSLLSLRSCAPNISVLQIWRSGKRKNPDKWARLNNELLFMFNHDITFENGRWATFPPLPPWLNMALRYGLSWWKFRWWKFASCGTDGLPKPLYAVASK